MGLVSLCVCIALKMYFVWERSELNEAKPQVK